LSEEKETDEKLTEIAKEANAAISGSGSEALEEVEEPESTQPPKRSLKARSARA